MAPMKSIFTCWTVGCGLPHQFGTASNCADCFGMYETILYGPVPTAVAGFDHQLASSVFTTFESITCAAEASASSVLNTYHGEITLITSVWASGADMPLS